MIEGYSFIVMYAAPCDPRNVPYDADEADLKEHFAQFGPVRYCRTVFDPETGMSRGMLPSGQGMVLLCVARQKCGTCERLATC